MKVLDPFKLHIHTTSEDSGMPLLDFHAAVSYWQERAFTADDRANRAERAARFYAACAVLFLVSCFGLICVWSMVAANT